MNFQVYAAGSDDDADYRKMINLKYSSTMNKDSAIDREKMATGGENPDAGPEVDIRDLTKRNDEIKKGLQGNCQNILKLYIYITNFN